MTTDRELLELAAKAAGIEKDESPYNGGGTGNDGFSITGDMMLDWHNNKRWNPLTDEGDALRLAVKLKMTVDVPLYDNPVQVRVYAEPSMYHIDQKVEGNDPYAATRRAIVRAAAEIGRDMK